jgi:hypothetical protein
MTQVFEALYNKANEAGKAAVEGFKPQPMIVGSPSTFLGNDIDPSKPTYFVEDGVCGFAWVQFKGNTPWGRWAKKNAKARPGYPSGLQISVHAYNQSMQKKEVYAAAFAKVLQEAGIEAYSNSRMD